WLEAIPPLKDALQPHRTYEVRRSCADALVRIRRAETQEALLTALLTSFDPDAEIRGRVTLGLKQILGKTGAVSLLVAELLRSQDAPDGYVAALADLDRAAAAQLLLVKLLDADLTIRERAARALVKVGKEEVFLTFQLQRAKALEGYSKVLGDAD